MSSQIGVSSERIDLSNLVGSLSEGDAQLAACGAHMLETMASTFGQIAEHTWQSITSIQAAMTANVNPLPIQASLPPPQASPSGDEGTAIGLAAMTTIGAFLGAWKGGPSKVDHKAEASPPPEPPKSDESNPQTDKTDGNDELEEGMPPIHDEPELSADDQAKLDHMNRPFDDSDNGVVSQGAHKDPEPPPPME